MSEENLQEALKGPSHLAVFCRRTATILGLLLFLITVSVVIYQRVYSQRIFPGVRVQDIDVSTLGLEEAEELIAFECRAYSTQTNLALKIDGKTWRFTPQQLGVRYDIEKALANAYEVGRTGNPIQRLSEQATALIKGTVVPLAFNIDRGEQERLLADLASKASQPMINAGLKIESLKVTTTPALSGRELDKEETARLLAERFALLSPEPLDISLKVIPPLILESDLAAAKARAEQMISNPLTLKYTEHNWIWENGPIPQIKERSWQLDPAAIADMISFQEIIGEDGRPKIIAAIDRERGSAYGARLARQVDQEVRDARFQWEDGPFTPIITSLEGRKLDIDTLVERLEVAAASADARIIELPVVSNKPRVAMEEIENMGIGERIEERRTVYTYSGDTFPERAANVELAAQRLHGVVISPGEVFSLNETLGEVSEQTGYKVGFSIVEGETVPDVGGGICQVSTTLFQTVFWAGYPIVERHPHSYRMRRYEPPPGLDATIYPPNVDLKFKNNTETFLLIQTRTDDTGLYVSLYGTKPPWRVSIEEPILANVKPADQTVIREYSPALAAGRQIWVEKAEDGVDITIIRIITQEGKEAIREKFFSSYAPQRNVLIIGTGE